MIHFIDITHCNGTANGDGLSKQTNVSALAIRVWPSTYHKIIKILNVYIVIERCIFLYINKLNHHLNTVFNIKNTNLKHGRQDLHQTNPTP